MRARYESHCSLDGAWLIARKFNDSYFNVYGINNYVRFKLFTKIEEFDLISMEFREILSAVVRMGTCSEFALGSARLLRNSLGCKTRVAVFKTVDHAFPEVRINGTWYVFDLTYTTRNKPVEASKYAEYLHNECVMEHRFCEVLRAGFDGLMDSVTGEDLRAGHGFNLNN